MPLESPKERPFRFKSTKQKLRAITLDANVEENGLNAESTSCCTAQALIHWQELCCSHDFNSFIRENQSKCQSLPQVVLHAHELVEAILSRLTIGATNSVPALLGVLSGLARDLGLDFLQHLERMISTMLTLLDDGAIADPELLEAIFNTLAQICKQRRKYFLSYPSQLLSYTYCLRLHRSKRIRQLTSRIIGFVLRITNMDTWDVIYIDLIDDVIHSQLCIRQQKEVAAETGEIIFHAISGAAHGVHSLAVERVHRMLRHTLTSDSLHQEIHVTLMKTCMRNLLEHVKGYKSSLVIWAVLEEMFKDVMSGANVSTRVAIDITTLCVQPFSQFEQVNVYLSAFNYLACKLEPSTSDNDARVLASMHDFVEQIFNASWMRVDIPSETFSSLGNIPWSHLLKPIEQGSGMTFINKLYASYKDNGSMIQQNLISNAFIAAYECFVLSGEHAVQLVRKVSQIACIESVSSAISQKLKETIGTAFTEKSHTAVSLIRIYYIPFITVRAETLRLFCSMIQDDTHKLVSAGSDVAIAQNSLAMLTACIESILRLGFNDCLPSETRLLSVILDCTMRLSVISTMSPCAWVALTRLFGEHFLLIKATDPSAHIKILNRAVTLLDANNHSMRLSSLETVVFVADHLNMTDDRNDLASISKIRAELDLFRKINAFRNEDGNLLSHVKHCTVMLTKASAKTNIFSLDSFQCKLLVKSCMGALRIRITALWPALSNYLCCLINFGRVDLNVVIDCIIAVESICLAKERVKGSCTDLTVISTIIDNDHHPSHKSHDWVYMDLLLNVLVSCGNGKEVHDFVSEHFVLFTDNLLVTRSACGKVYDKCLRTWLKLLRNTIESQQTTNEYISNVLKSLIGYDNVDVATEALGCFQLMKTHCITSEMIEYLRLLIDPGTIKWTLLNKRLSFDDAERGDGAICIGESIRVEFVPIIIRILHRHVRRNDRRGIRSACLEALAMFSLEEIIPVIARSLSGVVQTSEDDMHINLLTAVQQDWNHRRWLDLGVSLKPCSKTTLAFLLNLRVFMRSLRTHLQQIPYPFIIVCYKIFVSMADGDVVLSRTQSQAESCGIHRQQKLVYRECAETIVSLTTHFTYQSLMCWPIIADTVRRICADTVLPTRNMLPCLLIVQALICNSEVFSHSQIMVDVRDILHKCWQALAKAETSQDCQVCIIDILENMVQHANSSERNVRINALQILRCEQKLPAILLAQSYLERSHQRREDAIRNLNLIEALVVACEDDGSISDVLKGIVQSITCMRSEVLIVKLLQITINILGKHKIDSAVCVDLMCRLAFLFGRFRSHVSRSLLVDVYERASRYHQSWLNVVMLMRKMNCVQQDKIDELDVRSRLQAYDVLSLNFFGALAEDEHIVEMVIRQCVFDLKFDEIVVRLSARKALTNFAMVALHREKDICHPLMKVFRHVLDDSLPPLLRHRDEQIRHEGILLLRSLLDVRPLFNSYSELLKLVNFSGMENFFEDVLHIQVRYQCRALQNLTTALKHSHTSSGCAMQYILPLLEGLFFTSSPNVVESALCAMTELLRFLTWDQYVAIVGKIRRIRGPGIHEKFIYRALISVNNVCTANESTSMTRMQGIKILHSDILPHLETQIIATDRDKNLSVVDKSAVHAFFNIVCLLPPCDRDIKLRVLTSKLVDSLRNRSQKVRDSGRRSLQCIFTSAPSIIMVQMLQIFITGLNKGFARYVRAAVVHSALNTNVLANDDFKMILPFLAKTIENDLFGDLYDSKQCSTVKTFCLESRKVYPKHSAVLLFQRVHDSETLRVSMRPVTMAVCEGAVDTMKLQTYLQAIRQGLSKNVLLSPDHILVVFFSVLSECVESLSESKSSERISNEAQKQNCVLRSNIHVERLSTLANFAMSILSDVLREPRVYDQHTVHLELKNGFSVLLESFIKHRCLQLSALQALKSLVRYMPDVISGHSKHMFKQLTLLLKNHTDPKLIISAYSLLNAILKANASLVLNQELCDSIIGLSLREIRDGTISKENFKILRVMVARRVVVPGIYDVIEEMISTIASGKNMYTRASCSRLVIQFMLVFPIGERRMRRLIDLILPHADYKYVEGRSSIFATIAALVTKIPEGTLACHSELLFVFLLTKLASELDETCRTMCLHTSTVLIHRVSQLHRAAIFRSIIKTISDSRPPLVNAALQILKMCIVGQVNMAIETYSVVEPKILQMIIELAHYQDAASFQFQSQWTLLYSALLLVERGLNSAKQHVLDLDLVRKCCDCGARLLQYPHLWVQMAACRFNSQLLLYSNFKQICGTPRLIDVRDFADRRLLFLTTVDFLRQLCSSPEVGEVCDATTTSILKLLVALSSLLIRDAYKDSTIIQWNSSLMFKDEVTGAMYSLKMSKCGALQTFSLRWIAAVASDFGESLDSFPQILGDLVAICRARAITDDNKQKLSDDVIECLSACVSSEPWQFTVTEVDKHLRALECSSLGKRIRHQA